MSGNDPKTAQTQSYILVPAREVADDTLRAFAVSILPESPPERILQAWWRRANPSCAVVAMHEATGELAGICVGRPSEWLVGGKRHPAVAICGWYVAPDHAGRRLGHRLVRHFEAPDRLLYAYSISNEAVRSFVRLGWVGPYTSSLLALPLPRVAQLAHAMLMRNPELTFADHAVDTPVLPEALGADLDRIEQHIPPGAPAQMRRGSEEWSWRLSVCGERRYRFSVVSRSGAPVGYVAVRRMARGANRILGNRAAIVTDLVTSSNDSAVLRALIVRAVAFAVELGAAAILTSTTIASHRNGYEALGFLSSSMPVLGRPLQRRAPQFMWQAKGPAAALAAKTIALSFSDSDVDLNL